MCLRRFLALVGIASLIFVSPSDILLPQSPGESQDVHIRFADPDQPRCTYCPVRCTDPITGSQTDLDLCFRCISVGVCRFILRLRQVYLPQVSTLAESRSLVFISPRLVGNLGAPLEPTDWTREESDDEAEEEDVVYISDDPLAEGLGLTSPTLHQ